MSIVSEIARIREKRNLIREKLIEFKIANDDDTLDELADEISSIAMYGDRKIALAGNDLYTIEKGYHDGSETVEAESNTYEIIKTTLNPMALVGTLKTELIPWDIKTNFEIIGKIDNPIAFVGTLKTELIPWDIETSIEILEVNYAEDQAL